MAEITQSNNKKEDIKQILEKNFMVLKPLTDREKDNNLRKWAFFCEEYVRGNRGYYVPNQQQNEQIANYLKNRAIHDVAISLFLMSNSPMKPEIVDMLNTLVSHTFNFIQTDLRECSSTWMEGLKAILSTHKNMLNKVSIASVKIRDLNLFLTQGAEFECVIDVILPTKQIGLITKCRLHPDLLLETIIAKTDTPSQGYMIFTPFATQEQIDTWKKLISQKQKMFDLVVELMNSGKTVLEQDEQDFLLEFLPTINYGNKEALTGAICEVEELSHKLALLKFGETMFGELRTIIDSKVDVSLFPELVYDVGS